MNHIAGCFVERPVQEVLVTDICCLVFGLRLTVFSTPSDNGLGGAREIFD